MTLRTRLLAAGLALLMVAAAAGVVVDRATRPLDDDRYVVLMMGSDMGPWRAESVFDGRSDALHLVVVVPSTKTASILSFPRDSYVPVPGMGTTRINAALTRGPEVAVETMENLTGIEIDDWIVTGMGAFTQAIEDLGGLTVDVQQRLSLDNNSIEPGIQLLNGADTLLYGRDRKSRSDGDFGRNRAQAEILSLLHAQIRAGNPTPAELMGVLTIVRRNTVSSISAPKMAILGGLALEIDPANVYMAQVPGSNADRGGASVVVLGGGAEALFADLRDDGQLTP